MRGCEQRGGWTETGNEKLNIEEGTPCFSNRLFPLESKSGQVRAGPRDESYETTAHSNYTSFFVHKNNSDGSCSRCSWCSRMLGEVLGFCIELNHTLIFRRPEPLSEEGTIGSPVLGEGAPIMMDEKEAQKEFSTSGPSCSALEIKTPSRRWIPELWARSGFQSVWHAIVEGVGGREEGVMDGVAHRRCSQ